MKLKKILAALALTAAATFGAIAENHPYGMDIALGVVGFEHCSAKFKYWRNEIVSSHDVIEILPIKVNTYCCPWVDHHIGIYGSIGLLPGVDFNYKQKTNGFTAKREGVGFNFAVEFMVGPCFGLDLGESSVRFQVGAPLHVLFGVGALIFDPVFDSKGNWVSRTEATSTFSAVGLGLTPQFRFAANKRCSFVVGADFVFDFVYNQTLEINGVKTSLTNNADSTFRFGFVPYLGLGINFGD